MKVGQLSGGHFARQMEKVHSCSHGIRKKSEKNPVPAAKSWQPRKRCRPAVRLMLVLFRYSAISIPALTALSALSALNGTGPSSFR
jgi:hypothetical protein